jgi:four helix bundle protein
MAVRRFQDLVVWQGASAVALMVYRASGEATFSCDPALKWQMRRAAVSVMSNIAEGFGRSSAREFKRFLAIARGSNAELQSQLHLALQLRYLAPDRHTEIESKCLEVHRMLASLWNSIAVRRPEPPPAQSNTLSPIVYLQGTTLSTRYSVLSTQ